MNKEELRDYRKAWRSTFVGRCKQAIYDARKQAKKYGHAALISTVDEMIRAWTGRCHVCMRSDSDCGPKRLGADHCHATGEFRGWVCLPCNATMGNCNDSPELLRRLAEFLEGKVNPNKSVS